MHLRRPTCTQSAIICIALLLKGSAALAFTYTDFSSTAGLSLVGSAAQNGNVLRLTPAAPSQVGSAWYTQKQHVSAGFTTSFSFRLTGPPPGADGISFNVQNLGINALGNDQGTTGGLSISLNTFQYGDEPSSDFVGIYRNGYADNSGRLYVFDLSSTPIQMKDGNVHNVTITYDGAAFSMSIDCFSIFNNLAVSLSPGVDPSGNAYVGFGSRTGGAYENHDVLNWTFTSVPQVSQNEFWVSALPNPDPTPLGTIEDPYDGSTQSKFDSVMSSMPANCTIHLLGGTYMTKGNWNGFWIKTGQRILGSGIDITTIKLTNSSACTVLGDHDDHATGIEVSDMTLDANAQNNGTTISFGGIAINGSRAAIRRVKVVNTSLGTEGFIETWCILVAGADNISCDNVVIEDCIVMPSFGAESDGISVFAGTNSYVSARISGNWIYGTNNLTLQAFNLCNSFNTVLRGNHVIGGQSSGLGSCSGIYSDSGGNTNLTVVNNYFENVFVGVALLNNVHQNLYFSGNKFEINYSTNAWWCAAFWETSSGHFINEKIIGNTIKPYGTVGPSSYFAFTSDGCTNLFLADNSIDKGFLWNFPGCTNVNLHDNVDLSGNFLSSTNQIELPNSLTRRKVLQGGSSAYTAQYQDRYIGVQTGLGVSVTITLPSPVGYAGKEYVIVNERSSGNITIAAPSGSSINNLSSISFSTGYGGSKTVTSDGSNWFAR